MKQYQGRNIDLRNRINKHLGKLTGLDDDFYSRLSQSDLIELKTVYADINNLLTLKMTNTAAKWLCNYFKLSSDEKKNILHDVDQISPNAKGFDIHFTNPLKVIAEVKCISPVNKGNRFGAAQRNAILDDLNKLNDGKKSVIDTSRYIKILFLMDMGDRSTQAILQLMKESKIRIKTPMRIKRNDIKKYLQLLTDKSPVKLNYKTIYIKALKID
jgi:vesicle coat complex subunit